MIVLDQYLFSDPVLTVLRSAGWTQGRTYNITSWLEELEEQGYELSAVARQALASYGGMELDPINRKGPNFSNDEPLVINPVLAGSGHRVLADELGRELGGLWYPFGEWLSGSSVFICASGWTVATGMEWVWELGASVEEAIEFALMAHKPLVCLRVLKPGTPPWPPRDLVSLEGA